MKVVITGGAGFLGLRLAHALLERGIGPDGERVESLVLADRVEALPMDDPRVHMAAGDIADPAFVESVVSPECDIVYHLAAVVSSQAEEDFDLGMRVNVDASRLILERCRALGTCPRVIFTSSVAVFGPAVAGRQLAVDPRSSYGAEKAVAELLLKDYSRRGFVDGIALRLPTISVRPGLPNKAASSFASGILREPLAGVEANCPVPPETRLWLLSPRRAISALVRAAGLVADQLGGSRVIDLPGVSVSVEEMISAVGRAGGDDAVSLISHRPDPAVEAIVASWPDRWDDSAAIALGFEGDAGIDEIVESFIADDLPRQRELAAS